MVGFEQELLKVLENLEDVRIFQPPKHFIVMHTPIFFKVRHTGQGTKGTSNLALITQAGQATNIRIVCYNLNPLPNDTDARNLFYGINFESNSEIQKFINIIKEQSQWQ